MYEHPNDTQYIPHKPHCTVFNAIKSFYLVSVRIDAEHYTCVLGKFLAFHDFVYFMLLLKPHHESYFSEVLAEYYFFVSCLSLFLPS